MRRPRAPRIYDNRYRHHVPGIYSKLQFAVGTPIILLYEKGDAVRIEPRSPSPNTCRLCARSSRTLFRPQASGDGTRVKGVFGESRASCQLSINNSRGQDQTQAHSSSNARGSTTTPDHGSHIHRIVRSRCRTESSWLRAGRVWACTRPLQSVHAAADRCAVDELSLIVSYVMSTALWDVLY